MAEIGMGEAARRLNMSTQMSARRALTRAGITLRPISTRALVVDEADLEQYIAKHGISTGRGRPRKDSTMKPGQFPERTETRRHLEDVIKDYERVSNLPEGDSGIGLGGRIAHLGRIAQAGKHAVDEYNKAWGEDADQELLDSVPAAFTL